VNFQQLRIVRETVRQKFNLTEVANALYTSQSGVSKHIKDLEDELGVELFVRKGKRFLGLTDPGKELALIVDRMLLDAKNIKSLAAQFTQRNEGQLTIATTHTQARYALPRVVAAFKLVYPKVHLVLLQGSPTEIVSLLLDGEADLGVATEALSDESELACFPFYTWEHSVVVPRDHPLAAERELSLSRIGEFPIVTYHAGFTGRRGIDWGFADAGVTPDIVMSALDSDVIKTYVRLGLGVGIVASMAFEPERDTDLVLVSLRGQMPPSTTVIAVRRGQYLRGFAYRFIELCMPELTEARVRGASQAAHRAEAAVS
jgi:LysR family cys regulon transcriptional activator